MPGQSRCKFHSFVLFVLRWVGFKQETCFQCNFAQCKTLAAKLHSKWCSNAIDRKRTPIPKSRGSFNLSSPIRLDSTRLALTQRQRAITLAWFLVALTAPWNFVIAAARTLPHIPLALAGQTCVHLTIVLKSVIMRWYNRNNNNPTIQNAPTYTHRFRPIGSIHTNCGRWIAWLAPNECTFNSSARNTAESVYYNNRYPLEITEKY